MRDVPERHRSLRAAFDQSWRLLTDEQRSAFSRLSVFRGSFDRERRGRGRGRRPAPALRARREVARAPSGLRPLRAARAAAPVRGRAARRPRPATRRTPASGTRATTRRCSWSGRRRSSARSSRWRGTSCAASWTTCAPRPSGPSDRGRRARGAGGARSPQRVLLDAQLVRRRRRRSSGSRARPASTPTTPQAQRCRAGGGDVLARARRPARVRRRSGGARRRAACPSCARGTWSGSSRSACAPWASWRCIGTSTRRRWRYLEEAAEIARAVGDELTESGALIDLGWSCSCCRTISKRRARRSRRARVIVEELGNPLLRAYATSKLGLLADAEERYADAIRLHMEANELFASVGDAGGAGYTLSRASLSAFGWATTRRRCGSGAPATRRSPRSTTAGA